MKITVPNLVKGLATIAIGRLSTAEPVPPLPASMYEPIATYEYE